MMVNHAKGRYVTERVHSGEITAQQAQLTGAEVPFALRGIWQQLNRYSQH